MLLHAMKSLSNKKTTDVTCHFSSLRPTPVTDTDTEAAQRIQVCARGQRVDPKVPNQDDLVLLGMRFSDFSLNMAVGQNLRYLFGVDYPPKVVYFEHMISNFLLFWAGISSAGVVVLVYLLRHVITENYRPCHTVVYSKSRQSDQSEH